jgi:putative transposase
MVERMTSALPISRQCRLLALPRSSVYRNPAAVSAEDLVIMALIDRHYLARPYYGSRRMAAWLATQGHRVNRKRVQRLMRLLGLAAIYQRPNTSKPAAAHKIYPYLMRGLAIERVNQVWCSDTLLHGSVAGRSRPPAFVFIRRYSGRPSSSMRFSEATAMATSVVCRPSVRERSASPITRL